MSFLTKFWNWIIEKSLKDIINYVKGVVDEATLAADLKTFGGWSGFLLNLLKDLLEGFKQINATVATKAMSSASVEKQLVCRTSSYAKLKSGKL